MSNKTISVQDLRTLLENAWAAGYVAKTAGIEACESEYVRQKYVESKVAPYVPAKVEEVRKPDLFKDVDMEKIFKDFFSPWVK